MINRIIFYLVLFGIPPALNAQVGINTSSPQSIFHIDAKANTSGTANKSDDIVVTENGYLGIGTLTPKTRVDVEGSLSITNSGEGENYILTSDANGVGVWENNPVTRVNRMTIYEVSGVFPTVPLGTIDATTTLPATDNPVLVVNELNLTINSDNRLVVPPGLYMFILDFDLPTLDEYGQVHVQNIAPSSTSVVSGIYRGYLEGAVASVLITSEMKLRILFTAKRMYATTASVTYFAEDFPYYNIPYKGRVQIIQLQ